MKALAAVVFAALVGAAAIAQETPAAPTLRVGDPAPPLKVAGWVKGKPVTDFQKGKVYVVEFWATWCGPCKMSIPHLTDMAKQFAGKVTFVGVSAFEASKSDYSDKVPKFVDEMGEKMDYNVATDDAEKANGTMAKTWMIAAGQNSIPTAFVVGKKGTIEWIGHPMAEMDKVLEAVLADKFNARAVADEREKRDAQNVVLQASLKPFRDAAGMKDWKGAVAALDTVFSKHPEMEAQYAQTKLNILATSDETAWYAYARKLAGGLYKDNATQLNQLAWTMVDPKSQVKTHNYDLGVELAQRAVELSRGQDPAILDTLAAAFYGKGNVDKAIEYQTKAASMVDEPGTSMSEAMKKDIKARLEEYKKKKAG